eukprot:tig00001130_g7238.t1
MAAPSIKCVVVGDGTVGKTCLLYAVLAGKIPAQYTPTIFDNFSGRVWVGAEPVMLSLWDTAGQEEYDSLRVLSYPSTDVFCVCFSIADRNSFENVARKWIPDILSVNRKAAIILVGTKIDLRQDRHAHEWMRARGEALVAPEEGEAMARRTGAYRYVECSSYSRVGTKEVFDTAIMRVLHPPRDEEEISCTIL